MLIERRTGNPLRRVLQGVLPITMRKKIVFAAVAILALIACIGSIILFNFNDHTVTVTVTDKERIAQNNDSRYLIYTTMKDTGETLVLENTDNLLRLKFNSSDLYAELEEGKTYDVTVVCIRLGIFSWYENIIRIKEIQ